MADSNPNVLLGTIEKIFSQAEDGAQKPKDALPSGKNAKKAELELALAVLLVDLAGCDQNFEPNEYQTIVSGLYRMFETSRTQVQTLVNQALLILKNLRGVSRYALLLKENLSEKERMTIMEIVEEIIASDGTEDGFEIYLRHKISDMLGLAANPKMASETE